MEFFIITLFLAVLVLAYLLYRQRVENSDLRLEVADLKKAEDQLRKLSRAVEQSPSTVMITDTRGTIEYVNPTFTVVTGYSYDEATSGSARIMKWGDQTPEEYKELWDTITSGLIWRGEFQNQRKNGETYWESASISPIKNQEGIITHIVAVKEDITERKRTEAALQRYADINNEMAVVSSRLLQHPSLAEVADVALNAGLRLTGSPFGFTVCYDHNEQYFVWMTPGDEPGTTTFQRVRADEMPFVEGVEIWQALWESPTARVLNTCELLAHEGGPLDGRTFSRVLCAPWLVNGTVIGLICLANHETPYETDDISTAERLAFMLATAYRRQRDEYELQESSRRVEEANKELGKANGELELARQIADEANRLKSEFLANTSHELRTPLNTIIGSLKLIIDGLCDDQDEEREFIQNAYQSARHLLSLINDVLDIAKIEAGKMSVELASVGIVDLFSQVEALTHVQAANRNLSLTFETADGQTLEAYADPAKLKQVLINVVGNAIKFTPSGSVQLSAQGYPEKGHIVIQIIDTGIGISAEEQGRLFRAFVQADGSTTRQFGGTGLGLAISHRLMELMGGSITLHSDGEGMGTTVSIIVPIARPDVMDDSEDDVPDLSFLEPQGPQDGALIVVVEDDPAARRLISTVLQRAGYRTICCGMADEAFAICRSVVPDALVLDINLPSKAGAQLHTGWDLMHALAEKGAAIPVVIVTGHTDEVLRRLRVERWVPPANVLTKPVEGSDLIAMIQRVVGDASRSPIRVLVADDDPHIGQMLAKILPGPHYALTLAANGREALQLIRPQPDVFDVLLLDLMMPEVDGYQVLRELKLQGVAPDLPVVIITNYPEPNTDEERALLEEGTVVSVVAKSDLHSAPTLLLEKVQRALRIQLEVRI
jgi:PAS domain S-box-containing protein